MSMMKPISPVVTANQGTMPMPQSGKGPIVGVGIGKTPPPSSSSMGQPLIAANNFTSNHQALVEALQQKPLTTTGGAGNSQFPGAPAPLGTQNVGIDPAGGANMPGQMAATATDPQPLSLPQQPQGHVGEQQQQNLANTKEKTPMCLINELARFNKVSHQYTLVDEQGPAHKKTFYVKLKLGESEEYSADGPSIKKAQHAAATSSLEQTALKKPPPKPVRGIVKNADLNNITPTVELNALAMQRGEPAIYKPIEPRQPQMYPPANFDYRGMYNQRYHYPRIPRVFYVSLKVGQREFIGEGNTRQTARHNAAAKSLRILRNLPIPNRENQPEQVAVEESIDYGTETNDIDGSLDKDKSKSEISLVHEIALKRNLPVTFDVIRESGPPHMKNFVTRCTVGEFVTEAEGNSKKLSKKRTADLMLEELRRLPSLPHCILRPKNKPPTNKKKNRNLVKVMQKADPNYGVGINPISRLIQIQQAQKKKEPVYTLLAERGLPRRREFVMQVTVEDSSCTGVGPNKKLAKRHAAEAMLQMLGYSRPSPQPSKPAIKSPAGPERVNELRGKLGAAGEKKVTFVENPDEAGAAMMNGKPGRQLMPGLLLLPDANMTGTHMYTQGSMANEQMISMGGSKAGHRPEQQLKELARRHNIDVKFDEFAGQVGNASSEFLSRVSLATTPQHILHGTGHTPDSSRDAASLHALKVLADMGMTSVKEDRDKKFAGGDGPQIIGDTEELANSATLGGATMMAVK